MRSALVLVLVGLLAHPALTASNSVPALGAGAGAGAVSGYTVSSVSYSLDGETIDGVSFELSPAGARTVQARLAPDEPWTPCLVAGSSASCPVATEIAAASSLQVAAAS